MGRRVCSPDLLTGQMGLWRRCLEGSGMAGYPHVCARMGAEALREGALVQSVTTKGYAAVGLSMAAFLSIAGCTGDAKPTVTISTTSPASSTPSTSESTTGSGSSTTPIASASTTAAAYPKMPAAAGAETIEGAIAFTTHFFGLVNHAWTRPEARLLPPLFTATCTSCQNFEDNAEKYVREGTRYNKTPLEVVEVSPHGPPVKGARQTIDVVVHQVPASVVDANGKSVSDIKEQRGVFVAELLWMDTGWKLTSIKVLQ